MILDLWGFFKIFWVWVLCLHVCLCTTFMQSFRSQKVLDPLEVTDCSELPCGCWESNSPPLEEQPLFLSAEPLLQPLYFCFYLYISMLPLSDSSRPFTFLSLDSIILTCQKQPWVHSPCIPGNPQTCLLKPRYPTQAAGITKVHHCIWATGIS